MSTPSSGGADAAVSSQAAGVEDTAAGEGPRRGSRSRKPTSKAAGLDLTEAASSAQTRSSRKRKAADASIEPEDATEKEVDTVFAADGAEDENQYCICRGKDDGSFMISCEQCQEWLVYIDTAGPLLSTSKVS